MRTGFKTILNSKMLKAGLGLVALALLVFSFSAITSFEGFSMGQTVTAAATEEPGLIGSGLQTAERNYDRVMRPERANWRSNMENKGFTPSIGNAGNGRVNLRVGKGQVSASFNNATPDWSRQPNLSVRKEYLGMKDFAWVEPNKSASDYNAELTLPNVYQKVYRCEGDEDDPNCFTLDRYSSGDERPYYRIENGNTVVYMNSFSGAGGTNATVVNDYWTSGFSPDLNARAMYSTLELDETSTTNVTVEASNNGFGTWSPTVDLYNYSSTGSVSWSDTNIGTGDGAIESLVAADLNDDGDEDLVWGDDDANNVEWAENNGDGTYTVSKIGDLDTESASVGDIDGDGDLDVVVAGGGGVDLLTNDNGDASNWTSTQLAGISNQVRSSALGDVDGDGDLDVIIGGFNDKVQWLENDGSTSDWTVNTVGNMDGYVWTVEAGDLDGDGDLDVVAADETDDVDWFENDGTADPSFTGSKITDVGTEVFTLKMVDLNQDGYLDLVTGESNGDVESYINDNGNGDSWTKYDIATISAVSNGAGVRALQAGDMDMDGDIDLIAGLDAGDSLDPYFLESDGTVQTWSATEIGDSGDAGHYGIALSDFDDDGVLEIASGEDNENGGALRMWDTSGIESTFIGSDQVSFTDTSGVAKNATISWTPTQKSYNLAAFIDDSAKYTQVFGTNDESAGYTNDLIVQTASAFAGSCLPPNNGDWFIDFECTVDTVESFQNGNTFVDTGGLINITSEGSLDLNLQDQYVLIRETGGTATQGVSTQGEFNDGVFNGTSADRDDNSGDLGLGYLNGTTPPRLFTSSTQSEFNQGNFENTSADRDDNSGDLGLGYMNGTSADDMLAFYRMDKTSGDVIDYSGNNNDGTNNGAFRGAEGVFSTDSFSFDGSSSDHVDLGKNINFNGDTMAISTWIYPTMDGDRPDARIISKSQGTSESDVYYQLGTGYSDENELRFRLKTGGTTDTYVTSTNPLNANTWHHAVATYDGSEVRLYVDGEEEYSASVTGDITQSTSYDTFIGDDPGGARPWPGKIDELQLYDKALTDSDVNDLYLGGQDGTFGGDYNRTSIDIEDGKSLSGIEVDSSFIDTSGSQSWVKVEHSSGESEAVKLSEGYNVYELGFTNEGGTADVFFNLTADNAVNTPVIESFSLNEGTYNDLIGFWRMDKTSGAVKDYSSNGNDGTNNGATRGEKGVFSTNAFSFDSSNSDNVQLNDDPALKSDHFTYTAWVKTATTDLNADTTIYSKETDNPWNKMDITSNDNFRGTVTDKNGNILDLTGTTDIRDNQWHFVAFTYDGSEAEVFVDGVSEATDTTTVSGDADYTSETPRIGMRDDGQDPFNGKIDELRLYDRSLSDNKIKQLYFYGSDGKFQGDYESDKVGSTENKSRWMNLRTNLNIPANTDVNGTLRLFDGNDNLLQSRSLDLVDGETDYIIDTKANYARLNVSGFSTDPSGTWELNNFKLFKNSTLSAETSIYNVDSQSKFNEGVFDLTSADRKDNSGDLGIGYLNGTATDNLVGYWRMDRTSGDVIDYSGENNDGTTQNFDGDERGSIGVFSTNSFEFDGTNDYVSVPDDPSLEDFSEFTVSIWVKFASGTTGNEERLIVKQKTGTSQYVISRKTDEDIAIQGDNFNSVFSTQGIDDTKWHHVVATVNSSNTSLYIDGDLEASGTGGNVATSDFAMYMGGDPLKGGDQFLEGKLDEVQIRDNYLSRSEVEELYLEGSDGKFNGNYTSKTIDNSNNNSWNDLQVDLANNIVDDFEDGVLSEYTGDTGNFDTVTSDTKEGDYSLETTGTNDIISFSGLDNYPQRGDKFSYWVKSDQGSGSGTKSWTETRIRKDSDNYYTIRIKHDGNDLQLIKRDSGTATVLDTDNSLSFTADTWYRVETDFGPGSNITVTLLDESNNTLAQISADDSNIDTGGIQFEHDTDGSATVNWDDFRIIPKTDVDAEFKALDSDGSTVDTQFIDLSEGLNNYSLSVSNSQDAEVVFNGTSTVETRTWEINQFKVYSSEVSLTTQDKEISSVSDYNDGTFNLTSADRKDNSGDLGIGYLNGTFSDDLLGYWRMDRTVSGDGGTVKDYSGNGESATTSNGVNTGVRGVLSTDAHEYDGSTTYTTIDGSGGDSTWGTDLTGLTVSAWVKLDSLSGDQEIIRNQRSSESPWALDFQGSVNRFYFNGMACDFASTGTDSVTSTGEWYHVVGVATGTECRIYLNGEKKSTKTTDGTDNIYGDGDYAVSIGGREWQSDRYLDGTIDELKVYNRSFSDSEVKELYFYGNSGKFSGDYESQQFNYETEQTWNTLNVNILNYIVDDFEDGDISEYTGDTGSFSTVQSPVYEGSYALNAVDDVGVTSSTGLDNYPERGDKFSFWVRSNQGTGSSDRSWSNTHVGYLDGNNNYRIRIQHHADNLVFNKFEGGTKTTLTEDSNIDGNLAADTWYRVEVDWMQNGTIALSLYDTDGNRKTRISATDNTFDSGGIRFYHQADPASEAWWDNFKINSQADANATFRALDSGGSVLDSQQIDLEPGDNSYSLSVQDSNSSEIFFEMASGDIVDTWEISSAIIQSEYQKSAESGGKVLVDQNAAIE